MILHGRRASIASTPTLATLEAGSDGTAECASTCRTRVGRSSDQDYTQLDQALQQGGPGTAAGQVVETRVFGRPDTWDGGEKAWPHRVFVMTAYTTNAAEQRCNDRSEEGQECAVVLHLDHAVHGKICGSHRKCVTRLGHGGVATYVSCVFSEEQCKTSCGDARSVGVSVRHERSGAQSADQGVRELREHRTSRIP